MKPVFIYCLKDPVTRDVRYIGKTDNLKKRLDGHLSSSSKEKNYLGNWLRSLKGEKPILAVLHEVAKGESWAEEERRYISCARAMGVELVNATDGGEGAPGCIPTPETRAAMSAAWTPERRAAHIAAQTGVQRPKRAPEHCAALSAVLTGVPKSPEHCASMSVARTGLPGHRHTPEHCAAMSAALIGVPHKKGVPWTEAQRAAYTKYLEQHGN